LHISKGLTHLQQTQIQAKARNPRQLQLIIILGALSAFGPLSIDMYLPSLPSLTRDFGTGASQAELTLSACLLGLALGQTIAGPISDALGRRRPLLIGLAAYALASLLCVIAPSVYLLVALRFIQGLAGAAGIVIARAIVRDLYAGDDAARFFSLLMLVNGLAPILAPILGGLLLRFTSWRGVFVVLTVVGVLQFIGASSGLSETLPVEQRQSGGIQTTLATFRQLLTNRAFVGYALSCGLAFASMFTYISGSPFVLQNIYGLSPQLFSIAFGVNALGIMILGQVSGRLVGRVSPQKLLVSGLIINATGGLILLLVILQGHIGLIGILPALFLVVAECHHARACWSAKHRGQCLGLSGRVTIRDWSGSSPTCRHPRPHHSPTDGHRNCGIERLRLRLVPAAGGTEEKFGVKSRARCRPRPAKPLLGGFQPRGQADGMFHFWR
jgi:DHA1 family bicyclomycin/chloramphenicol resistance-like MFS transporter